MHKICEMKPSMVFASLPLIWCPHFLTSTEQKSLSRFSLFQEKPGKLIGNSRWLPFQFFPIYKVDFVTFHSAVSKKWGWQSEFQRIVQEGQVLLAWSESLPWPSISWCLRLHSDPRTQHKCQVQASDENHAWVILSAEVWSMSVLLLANYTAEVSRPQCNASKCICWVPSAFNLSAHLQDPKCKNPATDAVSVFQERRHGRFRCLQFEPNRLIEQAPINT